MIVRCEQAVDNPILYTFKKVVIPKKLLKKIEF